MARGKRQVTDQMLSAGQSGEAAKQRSHEGRIDSANKRADRSQRQQQIDNTKDTQDQALWQRQWEQSRAERAQRDAQREKNQAGKPRTTNFGGEGQLSGAGDPKLDESKRQFDSQMAEKQRQFDTSTQLGAAKSGLVAAGGGIAGGNPGPDNPRMTQMQQEMANRQKNQMGQGVEQKGQRGFVPSEESKRKTAEEEGITRTRAATETYRAITARKRLGFEVQKAQAALDATGGAGNKSAAAEVKAAMKKAEGPLANFKGLIDRLEGSVDSTKVSGGLRQNDWEKLAEMFGETPPVGNAAEVKQAIDSKRVNPRLTTWLAERQAAMVVDYVAEGTGELPDREYVDFLSSGMKMLMDQTQLHAKQFGIEFGGPGGLMAVRTRSRQRRMAQKLAAKAILSGNLLQEGGAPGMQEQGTEGQQVPDQALGRPPQPQKQPRQPGEAPTTGMEWASDRFGWGGGAMDQ